MTAAPAHGLIETERCTHVDIDELFVRLADSRTDDERRRWRCRIITTCMPIADRIARRFAGRGEPADDLIQVARIGLIHTVDRYEPSKGHFLAFAVPTIRGELKRHFRDRTWTVRVPRKVQETQLRLQDTVNTVSQRLGREPTDAELGGELDLNPDDMSNVKGAHWAYRPLSLDASLGVTHAGQSDTVGSMQGADDPHYGQVEELMVVRDAIEELDPRRRAIIKMVFFDSLTQREVASRFDVSQVQISRLLRDALERIRARVSIDVCAAVCLTGPILAAGWSGVSGV